jgi:hypothetical protein
LFFLRDNNEALASFRLYMPDGVSVSEVGAFANGLRSPLLAVTSATLVQANWQLVFDYPNPAPASVDSDVYRRFIALFRTDEQFAAITIPSPGTLPLDVAGTLRSIRLQEDAANVSGLLEALQSIVEGTVTPFGAPFPETYFSGGISRGVL